VPRQHEPSQNWSWGPKLSHVKNLGGGFVVVKIATLRKLGS